MAIFHLSVKTVSRAAGRSSVAAAAYRSGTVLHDERQGLVHDYARRRGVEAAFVMAPEDAGWTSDRSALWNAVEAAEKRKDAKVAREYELALPAELDAPAREQLVRVFAGALVDRFGVAVDVAIHAPGREGDQRNHHAHLLTTTRSVGADGMGAKTRELDVKQTSGPAIEALRALWAIQVNHALERIQAGVWVDHRSLERQGYDDREPTQHMGPAATALERQAVRRAAPGPQPAAEHVQPDPEAADVRSFGIGPAPGRSATRIGQHNAAVRERNQLAELARDAWVAAEAGVRALERAVSVGAQRVMGLARGLGASIAAAQQKRREEIERAAREAEAARSAREARERQEAGLRLKTERRRIAEEVARKAEEERQRAARLAPPSYGRRRGGPSHGRSQDRDRGYDPGDDFGPGM